MLFLFEQCHVFGFSCEKQFLTELPAYFCFRPQLVYIIIGHFEYAFRRSIYTDVYGPKAAIAGAVLKKREIVARAEEYTRAG